MESRIKLNSIIKRTVILIIPLSVLLFSYTASKLHYYDLPASSSYMMLFLLFYATYISHKYWRLMHYREIKFVILFFILSLPAYFVSSFTSVESVLRLFALIAFVPLGFFSGLAWGHQYNQVAIEKRDRIITLLLIPAIIVMMIIISTSFIFPFFSESERDYVFGMVILLPLLAYYRKKLLPTLFLCIATYICIISSKRTGLLCIASIVPFIFVSYEKGFNKKAKKVLSILLVVVVFGLIAYSLLPSISPEIDSSIERFENMDDQSSEHRLSMYMMTIDEISNSDILSLFFGHGCLGTISLYGIPTHNDWLEIIYDYGVIPFICFLFFYFSLVIRVFKSFRNNLYSSLPLLSTLIIFTITTMVNCMFTTPVSVFILLFTLGFSLVHLKAYNTR